MNINKYIYEFLITRLIRTKSLFFSRNPPEPPKLYREFIWGKGNRHQPRIPKTIWLFWNGQPSPCAQACLNSVRAKNNDFKIIVLNSSTLRKYLPEFPKTPKDLPIQLYSDLIRLMLLKQYGGIWLDHSIITTTSLNWIVNTIEKCGAEALFFYNDHHREYKPNKQRPIIENGLIAAHPNSKFIAHWLQNFEACVLNNNWKLYYKNKANYHELTENLLTKNDDQLAYFSCYIAAQETMLNSNEYNIFLINSEDEYYFYHYNVTQPINKINFSAWLLLNHNTIKVPKLIKLNMNYRNMIDRFIKLGVFDKNSILGKYLNFDSKKPF
jgi:Capsular polysaccharide synthesis protein